jgi:hypothetical protein
MRYEVYDNYLKFFVNPGSDLPKGNVYETEVLAAAALAVRDAKLVMGPSSRQELESRVDALLHEPEKLTTA